MENDLQFWPIQTSPKEVISKEVIFSRKASVSLLSVLIMCQLLAQHARKTLVCLYLDETLSVPDHINAKISNAHKGIGIIKTPSNSFPRNSLLIIYKSFIRLYLDYCDIIYDQPNNQSFCTKIELMQYNSVLAITGAMKRTSVTQLYNEMGLESLRFKGWFRRLLTFFKIKSSIKPQYLFNLIPTGQLSYSTQSLD